jgi:ATP synthase protein I
LWLARSPRNPPPLKVLPDQQKLADAQSSGQTLGRGMDFALVVLVFLGVGYGLDRWLGTRPLFMIGLVVFSVVGQFVKMYFEYTATMKVHEAERMAAIQSQPRYRTETQS